MNKEELEFLGKESLKGAAIGAFIGLGLSFTALSPLVIGGIIGFAPITALCIRDFLNNEVAKDKESLALVGASLTTVAVVGVALALGAAANSLFPGVMLSLWTAALVGVVIGAIGTVSSLFVGEYIIDPVITKVAECFSKEVSA